VISDPRAVVPHHIEHWLDDLEERDDLCVVYYSVPVPIVRDRLEVMGYTLRTVREAFEEYVKGERQQHYKWSDETNYEWSDETKRKQHEESHALLQDYHKKTQALLSKLNADSWLANLEEIRRLGLRPNNYGRYDGPHEDTLMGYMLSNEWYGFPGPDLSVALRLVLEIYPDAQELVYDVTDLIWSEGFDPEEDFVEYGLSHSGEGTKIILLTEGQSDSWILKESLNLLYPHLADYYSFMEFDTARVGGGAGNLANLVKAFVGAGIVNKTIAIFDNDTAGAAAIKSLERIALPPHIKVLRLPDLELLKSYPTIGPSGKVAMDVNGVAASIELYLGDDVLLAGGNQLVPVQWTGLDPGMRQYQGEVLDKDRIHERFRQKLECAKLDSRATASEKWTGLKGIFSTIFSAFHDLANKQICDWAREYYDSYAR
jgi:hypothetical protein